VAVSAKPREGTVVDTSNDIDDVGLRGRRSFVQADEIAVLLEDGEDVQQMEVDVKVETPAKALGE